MLKLNIGCGMKKLEGFVNIDSQSYLNPDLCFDIAKDRWPFKDSTVDAAIASHILEHLTTEQLFATLKELHRVCKDGAEIAIAVPHPRSDLYLNDPTHQRPIMPGTLVMFSRKACENLAEKKMYITPFWKILGVDFDFDTRVTYNFNEPYNSLSAEEALAAERHIPNAVAEIKMTIRAVKW